jgi:hypothetical protein
VYLGQTYPFSSVTNTTYNVGIFGPLTGGIPAPANQFLQALLPENGTYPTTFTRGGQVYDTNDLQFVCRYFGPGSGIDIKNIGVSCGLVLYSPSVISNN